MAEEIGKEYQQLAEDMTADLHDMLGPDWSDPPDVRAEITVTKKMWRIRLYIDARTKGGRKFWWAAKGTGIYGPKHRAYIIRPRRARALRFNLPHQPKTLPATAYTQRLTSLMTKGPAETVITQKVVAPGIRPRKFHERLANRYNNRQWTGGFYRRSENAARRGLRRGKQHVTIG
jgi:hypothetical protein